MRPSLGGTKKKRVTIQSPSNPMEDKPEPKKQAGAGNRGGRGAGGRTAARNDKSRRSRDARRIDKPKKIKDEEDPRSSKSKNKKKVKRKPKKDKSIRRIKNKRKKNNPAKPKKTSVKTNPTVTYSVTSLLGYQDTQAEILNAYIAMAGTELFQYVNSQTIDGMYSDVAIINVLSRRRQQYTPNRLIELAQVYVRGMWIADGELCIDIEDPDDKWDIGVLSLLVGTSNSIIAKTVN